MNAPVGRFSRNNKKIPVYHRETFSHNYRHYRTLKPEYENSLNDNERIDGRTLRKTTCYRFQLYI